MIRFRTYISVSLLCTVLVVTGLVSSASAGPASPSAVLDTLRTKDRDIATAPLVLSFEITEPANPFDPAQGTEHSDCTLTQSADGMVFHSTSTYSQEPIFRHAGVRDYRRDDFDDDGSLVVWRTVEKYSVSSSTRNDTLEYLQKYNVTPAGTVIKAPSIHAQLQKFPLGSIENIHERDYLMNSLGRGFSPGLEKVSSVKAQADGLAFIEGTGSYGTGLNGKWTAVAEPAADHLIRYARFTEEGKTTPTMYVESFGTIQGGGLTLAKEGKLTYIYDVKGRFEVSVHLTSITTATKSQTMQQAVSKLDAAPQSRGLETIDFRVDPPQRTFDDAK